MDRLKVLLSAFACQPGRGSEPGKGWACALATARKHQVWVITREHNRAPIESELAVTPIANLKFVYVELPKWMQALHIDTKKESPQITYYLWQIAALRYAQILHRDVGFDIAHHISYSKYWMPSFLWRLPVPLIWGPLGGGESAPLQFWLGFSFQGKVYELLRHTARWLAEQNPFLKRAVRRSALVLATSKESEQRLERLSPKQLSVYPAIGLTAEDIDELGTAPVRQSSPVRFLSVGRVLHWKGFHIGLQAFARFSEPKCEYWIIGDGPDLGMLKKLAADLGVDDRVSFLGRLSRNEVFAKLCECDILVHPSLHESGGLTCLEAMAARRAVICLDTGGPALQVSDDAGIRVPLSGPVQTVTEMANAMAALAGSAELRCQMGQAGYERVVQNYSWSHKVEHYDSLYRALLGEAGGRVSARPLVSSSK